MQAVLPVHKEMEAHRQGETIDAPYKVVDFAGRMTASGHAVRTTRRGLQSPALLPARPNVSRRSIPQEVEKFHAQGRAAARATAGVYFEEQGVSTARRPNSSE